MYFEPGLEKLDGSLLPLRRWDGADQAESLDPTPSHPDQRPQLPGDGVNRGLPFRWIIAGGVTAALLLVGECGGGKLMITACSSYRARRSLPYVAVGLAVGVTLSRLGSVSALTSDPLIPTHTILVQSADTKSEWMGLMQDDFNAAGFILSNGSRARVVVHNNGSVLQPELFPAVWSPQFSDFILYEQAQYRSRLISDPRRLCKRCGAICITGLHLSATFSHHLICKQYYKLPRWFGDVA